MINCKNFKILVMGRSGSGKTTFCNILRPFLNSHLYLNNDFIRNKTNNHDFSIEGRKKASIIISELADNCSGIVLIDMICPLKEMREIIKPDLIFYINREGNKKYSDTDSIFQPPEKNECSFIFEIN